MNKIVPLLLPVVCLFLVSSCNLATPEDYFDIAVLNCNLMHGFADRGLQRELESPSVKLLNASTGEAGAMKRKEIIDDKITSLQASFEKVKKLKETEDTREIVQDSLALYSYVLPVYENEYRQLAKLYDEGAAKEKIESLQVSIHTKYSPKFETLFDQLTAAGKPYAARHNITVKWDVSTAPAP